jgi:hypothetical protein
MPLLHERAPNSSSCRVLGSGQVRKTRLWLPPDRSDGSDDGDEDDAHLISQLRFLNPTPGTRLREQCVCVHSCSHSLHQEDNRNTPIARTGTAPAYLRNRLQEAVCLAPFNERKGSLPSSQELATYQLTDQLNQVYTSHTLCSKVYILILASIFAIKSSKWSHRFGFPWLQCYICSSQLLPSVLHAYPSYLASDQPNNMRRKTQIMYILIK